MPRPVAVVAAVVALLIVAELLAPVVAVRALERNLGPCLSAERLEITRLSRPVLPQVLLGRVRDAEVVATGIGLEQLRVERVVIAVPEASLPWRLTAPDQPPATVTAVVTAADARASLTEVLPFGLTPTLRFVGGEVAVGVPGVALEARFVPVVAPDRVALVPAVGPPAWWVALGLSLGVDLPPGVSVTRVDVGEDRVEARAEVDLDDLEVGDGPSCAADGAEAMPYAVPAAASRWGGGAAAAGGDRVRARCTTSSTPAGRRPSPPSSPASGRWGAFLREEVAAGRRFLPDGDRVLAAFARPFSAGPGADRRPGPLPDAGPPDRTELRGRPDVRPVPRSLANIFRELTDDLGVPRRRQVAISPRGRTRASCC
jgi:hypothetical protein